MIRKCTKCLRNLYPDESSADHFMVCGGVDDEPEYPDDHIAFVCPRCGQEHENEDDMHMTSMGDLVCFDCS